MISGSCVFTEGSTITQGVYTLILTKFNEEVSVLENENLVIIFFFGIDPITSESVSVLSFFEADELSITPCKNSSSTPSSNVLPPPFNHLLNLTNNLNQNKLGKIIMIRSNGRIEEKDFRK